MTPRDRRALLLGGTVVLSAVLLLRVVPWGVRRVLAAERDLAQRAALLARARAELHQTDALGDSAGQLTRALGSLAPKLLSGTTAPEAGADLAGRLNMVAARHRVKLERVDDRPDSATAGRLRYVALHANLESDIRGISGLLQALAAGDAALSVDELRLTASDPGGATAGPEVLNAEITVGGWYVSGRPDGGRGEVHP